MDDNTHSLKLFMVLLGSKAPKRNVEQHDYFFGIGTSIKDLVSEMKAFWPEAGASLHIDGWREVTNVDGFAIKVVLRGDIALESQHKLFFINLGGYQSNKLSEQHYTVLTVQTDRAIAVQESKKTVFYKTNTIKGANSHIDEKYGIDVDDIYKIEEILSSSVKEKYHIQIEPSAGLSEDEIILGYFRIDKLDKLKL
ncbi:MAG: DUF1543 domain-containing protein [Flavobacterium sp.]|nr:MAG: DUF1543 domain-containing protein [Flavobacterium sp.]